jgi:hypothetical protein
MYSQKLDEFDLMINFFLKIELKEVSYELGSSGRKLEAIQRPC